MSVSPCQIVHDCMHQRQSIGHLVEPAPNAEQLHRAVHAALTAPDHHRLKPTRFMLIGAEQRQAFGELLSASLAALGETDQIQLDRVKQHPFRAPILVLALTEVQQHAKVPEFEQVLSTGAAVENFLLSLQAQGFAAMWRTGPVVESTHLKQALGLKAEDFVAGIIYIGTAAKAIAQRTEIDPTQYLREWQA